MKIIRSNIKRFIDLTKEDLINLNFVFERSCESTVFCDIDLLIAAYDYFPEGFGIVVSFTLQEEVIGYCALYEISINKRKYFNSPYQKSLFPYGGFVINDKYRCYKEEITRIFKETINSKFGTLYIKTNPGIDIRPYSKFNYKQVSIPTLIIDINKPECELWASMESRMRRNIKKAEKKQLEIKIVMAETLYDIEPLSIIYKELCVSKSLYFHSSDYYYRLLKLINLKHGSRIFYALYKGDIISAMSVCLFRDTINPWFGGTLTDYVKTEAGSLIYWEILKYGSKNGFKKFDFLGLDVGPIAFYKKGFGGHEIDVYHVGHSPTLLRIIRKLRRVLIKKSCF